MRLFPGIPLFLRFLQVSWHRAWQVSVEGKPPHGLAETTAFFGRWAQASKGTFASYDKGPWGRFIEVVQIRPRAGIWAELEPFFVESNDASGQPLDQRSRYGWAIWRQELCCLFFLVLLLAILVPDPKAGAPPNVDYASGQPFVSSARSCYEGRVVL